MGKSINKIKIEETRKILYNGKDEVAVETIKNKGWFEIRWVWKLCNMDFDSDVVVEH